MSKIYILCVEDEPDVLDAIVRDIVSFEKVFPIETARSAEEARKVIKNILDKKNKIGLVICDHIMPGDNGVDLLVELQNNPETVNTKKILLTGQAGLEATVKAVNKAELDYYISKPWNKDELISVTKKELTNYVIETEKDLLPFFSVLDGTRLATAMRNRGTISDR